MDRKDEDKHDGGSGNKSPGDSGGSSNKSSSSSSSSGTGTNNVNQQMETVLQLLNRRMEGRVTTTQVESAVSELLTSMGAKRRAPAASASTKAGSGSGLAAQPITKRRETGDASMEIRGDTGNYDDSSSDDEDDNDNDNEKEHEDERKSESDNEEEGSKPATRKRRVSTMIKNQTRKNNKRSSSSKTEKSTKTAKRQKASSTNENFHEKNNATSAKQKKQDDELYRRTIAEIPMGTEAAKMMTTFGDGARPDPEALGLALMGTRRALQISIMDARKVRRRLQADYREAQSVLTAKYDKRKMNKLPPTVAAAREWVAEQQQQQQQQQPYGDGDEPCTPTKASAASLSSPASAKSNSAKKVTANSIDPKLLYRVLAEGTDKLSYSHKCGFHMEELTHLYPEEMRAFRRCHEMHEDFNESKDDDGKEDEANGENDNGDSKTAGKTNDANGDNNGADDNNKHGNGNDDDDDDVDDDVDGGHLRERAANFDFRTDQMKDDWYVEYSKVRLGSFLPSKSTGTGATNSNKQHRSSLEREWDKLRKVGRHARGEWENLNAKAVRFLHWLGFDPPNLYPPDDETTQALAFLAYDRLGRIVEKAICLRNETDPGARSLCEMPPGSQLSKEDVARALRDPDVKPATVYYYDETTTNTTDGASGKNGGGLASSSSSAARCGDAPSSFLSSHSIQLYFGPGWEDRLELEMEEMIASAKGGANHRLTEEERMVRNHELELLARISKPPEKEGVLLEALVQKHREQQQQSKRQQEADKAEDEEEGH